MVVGDRERCPACGTVGRGDAWCAQCGLELDGADAVELRLLAAELASAEADLAVVWTRRNELAKQHSMRQWAYTAPSPKSPPKRERAKASTPRVAPVRANGEWHVDGIRNFLLWTGAALLALSALAFTAVAWTHLGPEGRAALLFAVTIAAAVGAAASSQRLPATSGALTGLAIALALIDWQIVRRAGVGEDLALTTWWALGTAVVSLSALALGRVAARLPAHRAVAVLAPTSAVLAIAVGAKSLWGAGLALSLFAAMLAAILVLGRDRVTDRGIRAIVRFECVLSWLAAAIFALTAAYMPETFAASVTPAIVILSLAVAPAVGLLRPSARAGDRVLLVDAVLGAFVGAALTLMSTVLGPVGMLTFAAVLGCVAIAANPRLPHEWKVGAQTIGWLAALPGVFFAGTQAATAVLGPVAWFGDAWNGITSAGAVGLVSGPETDPTALMGWCAVVVLASFAVATAFALRPAADAPPAPTLALWPVVPIGALIGALLLVPFAADASAAVACAVATGLFVAALVGSALAVRDRPDRAVSYGIVAIIPAIPTAGWAALTPEASIAVLVVTVGAAVAAVILGREALLRSAHAALGAAATATLAAVIALAADASVPVAGFAAAAVAGVLMVVGSQLRRDTADGIALEIVGALGIAVGAEMAVAGASPEWLAGTLTVAVPLLLAASLRGHRTIVYCIAAALTALGATWAWLAAADVTVVEAYTLPAAIAALGLGTLARRDGPAHSWLGIGPAIVLALGPTLVLGLGEADDTRVLLVGVAALAILILGAWQRLQAPIVLGGLVLVTIAVDKLGPTAMQLPRWLLLAFAGSLLLWIGTTFERRRDDALRAARRFEQLG